MNDPQITFQQIRQLKLTQDDLKREIFETQEGPMKMVMNGEMKVLDLEIPEMKDDQKKQLITLLNKGISNAQKKILEPLKSLTA